MSSEIICDAPSPTQDASDDEYEFEVWQDEQPVAWIDALTLMQAAREASHYAAVYQQDGPVQVYRVLRSPVTAAELEGWARDGSSQQNSGRPTHD